MTTKSENVVQRRQKEPDYVGQVDSPTHEGYLLRQGKSGFKTWKKKWFVLKGIPFFF